jgi:phosphate transport system substrate-binding protein
VAINENALGFIGYNWLSNAKDPSVIDRSEEIRLVQLPSTQNPKKMIKLERAPNFFLRENLYPLTRELVVLSRELHQGLGTGFVNYILGPEGQRLVLMAGLYPVKPVSRQVELVPVPAVD